MSSNDIDYDSDKSIDFSNEELMFKMNDIDVLDTEMEYDTIDDVDNSQEQITNNYNEMTKEELLDYIKKDKLRKKEYIKKYQKTANGRVKTRAASKKYYDANRAKILEKKRLAYLERKNKNV